MKIIQNLYRFTDHCQDELRKITYFILPLIIFLFFVGCEKTLTIEKTEQYETIDAPVYEDNENTYGFFDYPLLDVGFNENDIYTVIITNEYSNTKRVFYAISNKTTV